MKRAAAVLLAGILTVTGCSGGGTTEAGAGTKSVSYAVSDPVTLNPGRQTIAFAQVKVLFSSLTFVKSDGSLSYLNAESVKSTDAVHWTVKLRPGWTFHNGEKVTAESYVK